MVHFNFNLICWPGNWELALTDKTEQTRRARESRQAAETKLSPHPHRIRRRAWNGKCSVFNFHPITTTDFIYIVIYIPFVHIYICFTRIRRGSL